MCKPFACDDGEDSAVLEALTDKEMFGFKRQFQNKRINKELRITLKWLDREGALDA